MTTTIIGYWLYVVSVLICYEPGYFSPEQTYQLCDTAYIAPYNNRVNAVHARDYYQNLADSTYFLTWDDVDKKPIEVFMDSVWCDSIQ